MSLPKPILVTGSHRSGSTWVGRMIAEAPSVCYIHEPFNVSDPPSRGVCNAEFKYWFTYITSENESNFYRAFRNTLELKFDLIGALQSVKSLHNFRSLFPNYLDFLRHRIRGSRVLLKDPLAFFSSEWLAEKFDMAIIVVIRHPAAFVSSVKKLNWSHPFSHFLGQPLLLNNFLAPFEAEIKEYAAKEHEIIDQAILLWNLIHYTVTQFQHHHPDWTFIRHEDLSRNPIHGFQSLFSRLQLEFTENVRDVIVQHTASFNPSDSEEAYSLKRNSNLNRWNWKNRLSQSEIEKIRSKVEFVSKAFYSDEDW